VWNVPLYTRVGTGYVFSSAFRTEEEARDEFIAHLESRDLEVSGEPRCIKMRIGRSERSWVKNCLAVGLAGGFIEPLESTAIYVIEMAIRTLIHHFPDRGVSPAIADHYNKVMVTLYDEILDFIVMHYLTANRRDPFWVAARSEIEVPDSLKERLEFWRHSLPGPGDTPGSRLFDHWNYLYVLYAKGFFDGLEFPLEGSIRRADWERFKEALSETKRLLVKNLPSHYELVTSIRKQAESGEVVPAAKAPQGAPFSKPQKATISVGTTFKPNIKMPTIPLPK
jgi:tryptophan halogenase